MLKNKILLFSFLLFAPFCACFSQNVVLKVTMDSSHIIIGDQLRIRLSLTTSSVRNLSIEPAANWKLKNCEIVNAKSVSSSIKNNQKTYSQEIIVTSFDTGVAIIEPIRVFESDTLVVGQSQQISFRIDSLPVFVDTTKGFKDIKMPLDGQDVENEKSDEAQIHWGRIIFTILIALALIGVCIFLIIKYLIPYLKQRKELERKALLKENAGSVALRGLKELRSKKLWQKGQVKDYYSELSMILRTYLSHQYDVNAKEMVTEEIMEAVEFLNLNGDLCTELQGFLELADLVKYAKEQPEIEKHETSIRQAVHFVQVTNQIEHDKTAAQQAAKSKK